MNWPWETKKELREELYEAHREKVDAQLQASNLRQQLREAKKAMREWRDDAFELKRFKDDVIDLAEFYAGEVDLSEPEDEEPSPTFHRGHFYSTSGRGIMEAERESREAYESRRQEIIEAGMFGPAREWVQERERLRRAGELIPEPPPRPGSDNPLRPG